MAKDKKDRSGAGALFIPGGLFLGFGIGFLFNNLVPWVFLGLGAGFIAFAISLFLQRKK